MLHEFEGPLSNRVALPELLALPYRLQTYFAQIRPIGDCTAEDGEFIGHMLMDAALQAAKAKRKEAVATFFSRTAMLREAPMANLATMLQSMISNESHSILAGDVATQDPAHLTAADAEAIGDGITSIRRVHFAPTKAVQEVFAQYAALRVTAQLCPWFEPMLTVIITRLMEASIGKKLRLAQSAALSLLDVGSDVFAMLTYYVAGEVLHGLADLNGGLLQHRGAGDPRLLPQYAPQR